MRALILLLFVSYPFVIIGYFIDGKYIFLGLIVALLIAVGSMSKLVLLQYRFSKNRDTWILFALVFLVVGVNSIAFSSYGEKVVAKGVIQLVGIFVSMLVVIAISEEIKRVPPFFFKLVRLSCIVLGSTGVVAILQSIYFNSIGTGSLFDFSFMNSIAGGSVWRDPANIGFIHRANSIYAEPAHMTRYLGLMCGVALMRVGFLGREFSHAIAGLIPKWCAWAILLAFLVSISLLGFALLMIVGVACRLVIQRNVIKTFFKGIRYFFIPLVGILFMAFLAGPELQSKLLTTNLIFSDEGRDVQIGSFETEQVSALAIAMNIIVMEDNLKSYPWFGVGLGGHPVSYYANPPPAAAAIEPLFGLNADDASGTLVRLLSETGIVGTAVYMSMVIYIIWRLKKVIVRSMETRKRLNQPPSASLALAIGIAGSLVGVFIITLARAGQYYELPLWLSMALAISAYGMLLARNEENFPELVCGA
jgi:hypothetical protein